MDRRTLLTLSLASGAVGGLSQALPKPFAAPAARGPRADFFPNVTLRTHDNRPVHFYDDLIHGKIVVLSFMVVLCTEGLCPLQTHNLVQVQNILGERVGREIFIYSITLQPELDTPEVLHGYAQAFGIKPGFSLLTGKPADIELLRRRLGYVDPDPVVDADKTQHTGMLRYGNEALDRWGACPALMNPQQIAQYILWMEPPGKA